jgi:hypothetical protein
MKLFISTPYLRSKNSSLVSKHFIISFGPFFVPFRELTVLSYLALHDVLFKTVTTEKSFLISAFWENAGLVVAGITVFIFHSKYRKQFKEIFRLNNTKALSLNITSEVLYTLGSLANSFATLLAPVAVVLVVSSYQPLFVFIIGIVLTTLIPSIVSEKLALKHLVQKILSIVIIIIGSYLLYSSSFN